MLKVENGGELRQKKRSHLARLATHLLVGAFVGAIVTNFFLKDFGPTAIGGIIGAVLAYLDTTHFGILELLRKFAGFFAGLYGILAILSPDKYPIAQLPTAQVPLAGLLFVLFAVFLLRRELDVF